MISLTSTFFAELKAQSSVIPDNMDVDKIVEPTELDQHNMEFDTQEHYMSGNKNSIFESFFKSKFSFDIFKVITTQPVLIYIFRPK